MTIRRRSPPRSRVSALAVAVALAVTACGGESGGSAPSPPRPDRPRPTPGSIQTTDSRGDFPQVSDPARDGSLDDVEVAAEQVATVEAPTDLAARPGTSTLYVTERAGRVRALAVAADGRVTVTAPPVLDITTQTTATGERGLLGLAFSADGGTLFVNHTDVHGDTRVAAYTMHGDRADPASRRVLLAVPQPFPNHNGGDVELGPDGRLWVGMGDGGAGDDPDNRAQDPANPLGKMLRLDPAGGPPEIWALGLRNPWRYSFDRRTGDLWIGDVGQDTTEEIDMVPAGTKAGTNFGWSGYEGSAVYIADRVPAHATPPVYEVTHADGWCAITGGVVYRGRRIAGLDGGYLFGDACKTGLHVLRLDGGVVRDERALPVEVPSLVSIDEDGRGEVYLVSLEGGIYRLGPG